MPWNDNRGGMEGEMRLKLSQNRRRTENRSTTAPRRVARTLLRPGRAATGGLVAEGLGVVAVFANHSCKLRQGQTSCAFGPRRS